MTIVQGDLDNFLERNYENWLNWFGSSLNLGDLTRKFLFKKQTKRPFFRLAPDCYDSSLHFLPSIKCPCNLVKTKKYLKFVWFFLRNICKTNQLPWLPLYHIHIIPPTENWFGTLSLINCSSSLPPAENLCCTLSLLIHPIVFTFSPHINYPRGLMTPGAPHCLNANLYLNYLLCSNNSNYGLQ